LANADVRAQTAAQAPNRAAQSWQEAYDNGVRAIRAKDWKAAIASMQSAKRLGPKPARRVAFTTSRVDAFVPDYYLGLAFLNDNQFANADAAFESLRQAQLGIDRDAQFRDWQDLASTAKFESTIAKIEDDLKKGDRASLQRDFAIADKYTAKKADSDRVQALKELADNAEKPVAGSTTPAGPSPAATNLTVTGPTTPPPTTPAPTTAPATTPPATPGASVPTPSPTPPLRPRPPVPTPQPVPGIDERGAIAKFYSGDYATAVQALTAIVNASTPGRVPSPRARFYLACSLVALVIVNGGDKSEIDNAQRYLKDAGALEHFASDRPYVSPRILTALGLRQ
jgi:TolA-binding protein